MAGVWAQQPGYEHPHWLQQISPQQALVLQQQDPGCPNGTVFDQLAANMHVPKPTAAQNTVPADINADLNQMWIGRFGDQHPVVITEAIYAENLRLQDELFRLRAENASAASANQVLVVSRQRTQDENSTLNATIARMESKRKALEREDEDLKKRYHKTVAQLSTARDDLQRLSNVAAEKALLETQVVELRNTIQVQSDTIYQKSEIILQLKDQNTRMQEWIAKYDHFVHVEKPEWSNMQEKLAVLSPKVEFQKTLLHAAARSLERFIREKDTLRAQLDFVRHENCDLRKRNHLFSTSHAKTRRTITRLGNELQEYREVASSKLDVMQVLAATLKDQDDRNDELQTQLENALEYDWHTCSHSDDADLVRHCLDPEHRYLGEKVLVLHEKVDKTEKAYEKLIQRNDKLEKANAELANDAQESAISTIDMMFKSCELDAAVRGSEKLAARGVELEDNVKQLKTELDHLTQMAKNNEHKAQNKIGELSSSIDALESTNAELNQKWSSQAIEHAGKIEELKDELATSKEEYELLQKSHEEQSDVMLDQAEELEDLKKKLARSSVQEPETMANPAPETGRGI